MAEHTTVMTCKERKGICFKYIITVLYEPLAPELAGVDERWSYFWINVITTEGRGLPSPWQFY